MAHRVWIKDFHVEQELKNNGVEVGVWEDGRQFGDLYVAKTGLTWCEGKTHRPNGAKFTFKELNLLASYKAEALKAPRAAEKADK